MTPLSPLRHPHGPTTGTATRSPRVRRFTTALAGGAAALLLLAPLGAAAQPPGTDAQKRDEVRRQKAGVAAGIDALTATDLELETAVRTLGENLRAQQARAHDANRAADDARVQAEAATAAVARTKTEVDTLTARMRSRAVEVYVHPNGRLDTADQALHAGDFTSAERKAHLLDSATGHDADVEDQLRGAKASLESARNAAAAAQQEAQVRGAEADAQVRQVQLAKDEKDKMKAALDQRIAGLRSEMSALSAQEAEINAIIQAALVKSTRPPDVSIVAPSGSGAAPGSPTTTSDPGRGPVGPTTTRPSATTAPISTPAPAPGNVGKLSWPVGGTVSSGYGSRWGSFHPGIDILGAEGTPIAAAAAGTVIYASMNSGGYGNLVLIDHGGGMVTAYAHQSRIASSVGDSVSRGQVIGYVGCTGTCTGPHLHFEVRINGSTQDPMGYL